MKVTVDLPDKDVKDVMRFTGEKKKGPAIAKLVATELMMRRRRELANDVLSGKFRVDFSAWEETQNLDAENPWSK